MIRNPVSQICSHRSVAKDGRIVCDIISVGDNEVSASLCHDCPARAIGCEHLRFTLQKLASSPITVRYATGRVEILDDHPSRVAFLRAACAEKVAPVNSPRECAGCMMHSLRSQCSARTASPVAAGISAEAPLSPAPALPDSRAAASGGKIILFPRRVAAAS